ncbi:hypothetical protein D3C84_1060040 [compost metagenome]
MQSALGDWHDHFQWCLKAEQEPDLLVLKEKWAVAMEAELHTAEEALVRLTEMLRGN